MKHKLNPFLTIILLLLIITAIGCKKDKLEVNEVKEYSQVDHVTSNAYDGGWSLTLQPDGTAEIVPSGDIIYRGTYKINGSKIKVRTIQDSGSYIFEIISETEIKEKEYGTVLRLK
ncbi:MAG: hypothetical protein EOO90_22570 [Pedobacter sp.]|nr:MAG: hypothetical protein EOO90_22570 [Pedobacter sp.]